jgi:hypothetical protein
VVLPPSLIAASVRAMRYVRPPLGVVAAVAAAVALPLHGAAPKAGNSAPACQSPEHHQLDFWIGDWDVYDMPATGKPAAHVTITSLLDKCVIHELYEGDSGLRGESFSIYDTTRQVWHQTWVTNRGQLLVIEGGMRNGRLMLAGHQLTKDNKSREIRAYWWQDKDGVRESSESSTDGGKTWSTDFDLVFKPHQID